MRVKKKEQRMKWNQRTWGQEGRKEKNKEWEIGLYRGIGRA